MRNPRALACGFRIFCLWRKSHEKIFPHFDGGVLLSFAAICKKSRDAGMGSELQDGVSCL